jgi:transcriptional regulator with XRE-family HTH domain
VPDDLSQRFAENLAYYLGKASPRLSHESLAAKAEIHRTQVSELLKGGNPTLATVVRLAGALGVSPADLIEGIAWEPAEQTGRYKLTPPKRKK